MDEYVPAVNLLFNSPQPVNSSELRKFPSKYRGTYLNSDALLLKINENEMVTEEDCKFKIHKNFLDSLKNEIDVADGNRVGKAYGIKHIGDSIVCIYKVVDTLFSFSNQQKLKIVGKHLILNTIDSVFWKVKIISFSKDIVEMKDLGFEEDLYQLDSISTIKSKKIDAVSYLLSPSGREFKTFVKLKNRNSATTFRKIINKSRKS
ncbi:MAG TPA: hypothetical protein VF677_02260 [Flavobacterium sp.]|jgi:hypothetical protein